MSRGSFLSFTWVGAFGGRGIRGRGDQQSVSRLLALRHGSL